MGNTKQTSGNQAKPVPVDTRKFCDHAANALMTLTVSVSRYEGRIKLLEAAGKAAQDASADANENKPTLNVNLLGSHQRDLTVLVSAFKAAYSYMGERFTSAGERNTYLLPVTRIPQAIAELTSIRDHATNMRDDFIPRYASLLNDAQASRGSWKAEAARKAPSADKLRERFDIRIGVPKPLTSYSPERIAKLNLPMDVAEAVARAGIDELAARLESARAEAIANAQRQLEVTAKQLTDGKRLWASLVPNTLQVARTLRDFAESYDRDPQLIALANQIEKSVTAGRVTNPDDIVDVWKNSPHVREAGAKLAQRAASSLATLAGVQREVVTGSEKARSAVSVQSTDKSATKSAAKRVGGGLLNKPKAN
jgi:hypothetical protein